MEWRTRVLDGEVLGATEQVAMLRCLEATECLKPSHCQRERENQRLRAWMAQGEMEPVQPEVRQGVRRNRWSRGGYE